MRKLALLTLAAALTGPGCGLGKSHPEPEWMKPPKGYQIKTADLTFNEAGMRAFNELNRDGRDAFIEKMKGEAGTFKGQMMLKSGTGLAESMPDSKFGTYELQGSTEAVLYEITMDFSVFTTPEQGRMLAPHKPIKFTGTIVDAVFQSEDKPRKLSLKIKADTVERITD